MSDLAFRIFLLMLATWSKESFMKDEMFSPLMGMIICFLDRLLVVILIWGLGLFWPLTMLLTWSIFSTLSDGNVSLIFSMSDVLTGGLKACAYDFSGLVLLPLVVFSTDNFLGWKYLEMMLISFLVLARRGGGGRTLLIVTGTDFTISFLLPLCCGIVLRVNFDETLPLRVLVLLSV